MNSIPINHKSKIVKVDLFHTKAEYNSTNRSTAKEKVSKLNGEEVPECFAIAAKAVNS